MSKAFKPKPGCPVPDVDAVAPLGFLFDQEIPEQITQFPLFDFPLPEPPSNDFGCYAPEIATPILNSAFGGKPKFTPSLKFPSADAGKCIPEFNFDVCIPCTDLTVKPNPIEVKKGKPAFSVTPTKPDASRCSLDLEFDVTMPPCVTLTPTATIIEADLPEPTIDFTVTQTDPELCKWELDLDIKLPRMSCVEIEIKEPVVTVVQDDPSFEVTAEKPNPQNCKWDFNFDLKLPEPFCVNMTVTPPTIVMAATPKVDLSFTKKKDLPLGCEWDCALNIEVPVTALTFQTPTITMVGPDDPPLISFGADFSGPNAWDFYLDLQIPTGGGGGGGNSNDVCECRVATTGLPGESGNLFVGHTVIDGVQLKKNDVVLVKDASDPTMNGPYLVNDAADDPDTPGTNESAWTRTCGVASGQLSSVREGVLNSGSLWMVMNDKPVTVGTTGIQYQEIGGCCCSARVVTTRAVTLQGIPGLDDTDGVQVAQGDIVLARVQAVYTSNGLVAPHATNGTYIVMENEPWIRVCSTEPGQLIAVREGAMYRSSVWMLTKVDATDPDNMTLLYELAGTPKPVYLATAATRPDEAALTLSGSRTVDKVTVSASGNKTLVLVKDGNANLFGLWLVRGGSWSRIQMYPMSTAIVVIQRGEWNRQGSYLLQQNIDGYPESIIPIAGFMRIEE